MRARKSPPVGSGGRAKEERTLACSVHDTSSSFLEAPSRTVALMKLGGSAEDMLVWFFSFRLGAGIIILLCRLGESYSIRVSVGECALPGSGKMPNRCVEMAGGTCQGLRSQATFFAGMCVVASPLLYFHFPLPLLFPNLSNDFELTPRRGFFFFPPLRPPPTQTSSGLARAAIPSSSSGAAKR